MRQFTITYDLLAPGKDYSTLFNELQRLGAKRILMSVWYVALSNTSAAALRDHLSRYVDRNDRLFVADTVDWAGRHLLVQLA